MKPSPKSTPKSSPKSSPARKRKQERELNENEKELLFQSLVSNDVEKAKELVLLMSDVDQVIGENDETALLVASKSGLLEIVQMLITRGADLHRLSGGGHSALSEASGCGRESVVRVLLEAGVDVNYGFRKQHKQNSFLSLSPLSRARKSGYSEIVDLLIQAGADEIEEESKVKEGKKVEEKEEKDEKEIDKKNERQEGTLELLQAVELLMSQVKCEIKENKKAKREKQREENKEKEVIEEPTKNKNKNHNKDEFLKSKKPKLEKKQEKQVKKEKGSSRDKSKELAKKEVSEDEWDEAEDGKGVQKVLPVSADEVEEEGEFLVERVLSWRGEVARVDSWRFLLRWAGYGPAADSWEPWRCVRQLAALDRFLEETDEGEEEEHRVDAGMKRRLRLKVEDMQRKNEKRNQGKRKSS